MIKEMKIKRKYHFYSMIVKIKEKNKQKTILIIAKIGKDGGGGKGDSPLTTDGIV